MAGPESQSRVRVHLLSGIPRTVLRGKGFNQLLSLSCCMQPSSLMWESASYFWRQQRPGFLPPPRGNGGGQLWRRRSQSCAPGAGASPGLPFCLAGPPSPCCLWPSGDRGPGLRGSRAPWVSVRSRQETGNQTASRPVSRQRRKEKVWGEELDAGAGQSEGKCLEAAESTRGWMYPKLGGSPSSSHPLTSQMGTPTPRIGGAGRGTGQSCTAPWSQGGPGKHQACALQSVLRSAI